MRYSSKLAGICNKQIKILKMLNFATFSSNYRHHNSINKGLPSITRRFFFNLQSKNGSIKYLLTSLKEKSSKGPHHQLHLLMHQTDALEDVF